MARTNVPFTEGLNGAASLIDSIGKDHISAQILKVLEPAVHVDHIVVFTFSSDGKPGWILTYGSVPPDYAIRLADQYVGSYFELDPNLSIVLDHQIGQPFQVFGFDPDKVNSRRYWETFYKNSDLIDKISILHEHRGTRYLTNYYRASRSGPFAANDKEIFGRLASLLTKVISLHADLITTEIPPPEDQPLISRGPDSEPQNRIDVWSGQAGSLFAGLSARERDICRLILIGFSTEAMALDLGLSINTIKTYRRRAYKKLEIVSANELHWKFHMRHPRG